MEAVQALDTSKVPSNQVHPVYSAKMAARGSAYSGPVVDYKDCGTTDKMLPEAELVSSEISGTSDLHTVMIDLDMEAALIPSSTPGHYHLYIDKVMPWRQYEKLLKALSDAGIIERGYYTASVARKHTALRLPWKRKPKATTTPPF